MRALIAGASDTLILRTSQWMSTPAQIEAEAIAAGFLEGRRAWPQLDYSRESFANHVGARLTGNHNPCWSDLYLAGAICESVAGATSAFEGGFRSYIEVAIARVDSRRHAIDDTTQRVLELVLFGTETRAAAIAGYAGRGTMQGWLRLIARREAIRALSSERGQPLEDEVMLELIAPEADPELALVKSSAASVLRAALLDAIAGLARDRRTILRLSVLDGLSIDQIAPLYQIHRGTVARRLETTRRKLLEATRCHLKERLDLETLEVDSLIGFARSQLDLCLEEALASSSGD